jgi:hypothetical protein
MCGTVHFQKRKLSSFNKGVPETGEPGVSHDQAEALMREIEWLTRKPREVPLSVPIQSWL